MLFEQWCLKAVFTPHAETWTSMAAADQKIVCRTMHYIGWMVLDQLAQPFIGDEWIQRLHLVPVPAARLRALPAPPQAALANEAHEEAEANDEDGWTIIFAPED